MILTQEGQGSFTDCGVYYKTLSAGMDVLLHSEESMPQNQQGPTICTKDLHLTHTHLPIKPVSGVTARLNFKTFQMILVGKGWTRHSLLAVCCKTILSGMDIQMHNKGNMTQYQRGWAGSGGITIATCSQIPHTHTPSFIRREREIDLQSGERQGQSFTFNMFCDMIAC